MDIASQRCDGKQRCEIDTGEDLIRNRRNEKPCLIGLFVYMGISYACIPGECIIFFSSWNCKKSFQIDPKITELTFQSHDFFSIEFHVLLSENFRNHCIQ